MSHRHRLVVTSIYLYVTDDDGSLAGANSMVKPCTESWFSRHIQMTPNSRIPESLPCTHRFRSETILNCLGEFIGNLPLMDVLMNCGYLGTRRSGDEAIVMFRV
jgi:hypothetical protein